MSLSGHQCHGLTILIKLFAGGFIISVHWAVLNHLSMCVQAFDTLKVLLVVLLEVSLAVGVARHWEWVGELLRLNLGISNNWPEGRDRCWLSQFSTSSIWVFITILVAWVLLNNNILVLLIRSQFIPWRSMRLIHIWLKFIVIIAASKLKFITMLTLEWLHDLEIKTARVPFRPLVLSRACWRPQNPLLLLAGRGGSSYIILESWFNQNRLGCFPEPLLVAHAMHQLMLVLREVLRHWSCKTGGATATEVVRSARALYEAGDATAVVLTLVRII